MEESSKSPHPYAIAHKELIGEPVRRPDGIVVEIWLKRNYLGHEGIDVELKGNAASVAYPKGDVILLGKGSLVRGAMRLGQAYYAVDLEKFLPGDRGLLADEIEELRSIGSSEPGG